MISPLSRDEFANLMAGRGVRPRLRRILRYAPEEITDWQQRDFLAVTDKSGREGVLLYGEYVAPFSLVPRTARAGGQVASVICDICATWQPGTASAVLTLTKGARRTVSHLVCADLGCSRHVRGLTAAGLMARSQVREDITPEKRIDRLHNRLKAILAA